MKEIALSISLMFILLSCTSQSESNKSTEMKQETIDSLKQIIDEQDLKLNNLMQEKASSTIIGDNIDTTTIQNKLYSKITPIKLEDYRLNETFNLIDTMVYYYSKEKDVNVSIYRCGNGPSDPKKDYCNGSYNLFIGTAQHDLTPNYYLHEVGPFVDLKFDSIDMINSFIYITHDNNGKMKKEVIKVELNSVKL